MLSISFCSNWSRNLSILASIIVYFDLRICVTDPLVIWRGLDLVLPSAWMKYSGILYIPGLWDCSLDVKELLKASELVFVLVSHLYTLNHQSKGASDAHKIESELIKGFLKINCSGRSDLSSIEFLEVILK